MKALQIAAGDRLSVLCLGAHSDDIEIGAGATLLSLMERGVARRALVRAERRNWREKEARASAADFLEGATTSLVEVMSFRDGFFPEQGEPLKLWFELLKSRVNPDVVLTHYRDDAHQDHRQVCRLTWNTFRDHLILEYEIPKWDGDLGQPNLYVPVSDAAIRRKVELLSTHFGSQRSKQWFDAETFLGLARLRGMECRAPERYAEAFFARKVAVDFGAA